MEPKVLLRSKALAQANCARSEKGRRVAAGKHGHQGEMDELCAALAAVRDYNKADWAANATMSGLLSRMATYSGQIVRWGDAVHSQLDLSPSAYTWEAQPPAKPLPNGSHSCATPGPAKLCRRFSVYRENDFRVTF